MNDNLIEKIKKARELAALADKATPGPWDWDYDADDWLLVSKRHDDNECRIEREVALVKDELRDETPSNNAELIAAAPEMAQLLREMASAFDELRQWIDSFEQEGYDDIPVWVLQKKMEEVGLYDGDEQ